jgi:hypothetical protein
LAFGLHHGRCLAAVNQDRYAPRGMNEGENIMALVGLVITFVGFLLAAASVGISSSNAVRLVLVVVGIMISLGGILGVINPAYQKNVSWKR